jgi:hypothetical protein
MQHEDLDLLPGVVAEVAGLGSGAGERDGDVAEVGARGQGPGAGGRERKHVRRAIVAQEFTVQAAQVGIARNQAVEGAALGHFQLEAARESLDGPASEIWWDAPERNGTALG